LNTIFPISGLRAQNPKQPIILGEKPASLFPFGWPIVSYMGWSMGKWKEGLFWGSGIPYKTRRKPILLPISLLRRRLSSCEGVPTPKISLIRGKTALLFWDIPAPWPVWQSGAFSQQKITANSGDREVKVW
jgi:hypothetical protein